MRCGGRHRWIPERVSAVGFCRECSARERWRQPHPVGAQVPAPGEFSFLPQYARAQHYRSLKQSSYDRTGGNSDRWPIAGGRVQEVFNATGPGVITHIWFTISARSGDHLKELVLRGYWDGNTKPSVEVPIGDFFGLNLGAYQIYESQYLACSPGKSLNSYFAMPYKNSARFTVTNEGTQEVGSFYSNIDYMIGPEAARRRDVLPCAVSSASRRPHAPPTLR